MSDPLNTDQARALLQDLRSLLDHLEGGELNASAGLIHRIEGAVVAIQVILGDTDLSDRIAKDHLL